VAATLLTLLSWLGTPGQAQALEAVGEPLVACRNPSFPSANQAFETIGFTSGSTALVFWCGDRQGRLDLANRRLEVLPVGTIMVHRPDRSLQVLGTQVRSAAEEGELPEGFYFSGDGRTFVIAHNQGLELRAANGAFLSSATYDATMPVEGSPLAVAMAPDGRTLAIGFRDGLVQLWGAQATLQLAVRAQPSPGSDRERGDGNVRFVAFLPDSGSFLAVTDAGWVHHWRLDGTLIRSFGTGAAADATRPNVDLSPDGTTLLVSGREGRPSLWSLQGEKGSVLADPETSGDSYPSTEAVRFSNDGTTLQVQTLDTIQIWSLQGTLLQDMATTQGEPPATQITSSDVLSPDGRWMVTVDVGKEVKLQLWKVP
jgi:WD40 repeat protein